MNNFYNQAAHCLEDVTRVEVLAGIHRIFSQTSAQYREVVTPRDIRSHPNYNTLTLINDIGLLFLIRRIPLNDNMQIINLPPQSHASNRFVGAVGTVVGWGRTTDGELIKNFIFVYNTIDTKVSFAKSFSLSFRYQET